MNRKILNYVFYNVKRKAKIYFYILLNIAWISTIGTSCSQQKYTTTKHIKPKTHNRYYNPKKDKKKKRTKLVRMKS